MEVNVNKLRQAVQWLREHVPANSLSTADNRVLQKFEQAELFVEADLRNLLNWLSTRLLDSAFTVQIALNFEEFLLLILSESIKIDENDKNYETFEAYQKKCIALAKLLQLSADARRFATNFFRNKPAPFKSQEVDTEGPPRKRSKHTSRNETENLEILKCCFQLLSIDPAFYKELWDWTPLVERYLNSNEKHITPLEHIYFNHIIAILSNMSSKQLSELNASISPTVLLQFDEEKNKKPNAMDFKVDIENPELFTFNFKSDTITNIEGVLLPVFNQRNFHFYAHNDGVHEQLVKVDSTKVNLRSIAMGIAATKTICLSGPVGCGKTTLVQYLARKTGRICPNAKEIAQQNVVNKENNTEHHNSLNGSTATANGKEENFEETLSSLLNLEGTNSTNGFLRIQLGDQTDSKMLLGQYRCTDVPGEFIWLPGILTQAVMNGYWLLLEDLDSATQDTYTILSGLLENGYLSVPGFRDCVKIQPGFQLFVTVRTNKSSTNSSQKALFSLLEKYIYTINILPLSRNELCKVISMNYPKLATVANRIVDVFLTFSSGDHNIADNLRQQETSDKADNTENYIALPFEAVSLASVPNAGRLVSTRDLIKLCQRSNPVFSVTSTECAYFVFQNAVDVFCSNLPQGKEKTKLIVSIGAKLGIIQSRCETYANDYKPEICVDNERIKVGRAELFTRTYYNLKVDETNAENNEFKAKRQKLDLDLEGEKCLSLARSRVTFSFTRLAICLLERIAVCVDHAEPVLLVGETGVGKTSSIQYLAERTEHKLIVVNMNNQSDVSDLIGSFKPVDLTYVLSPLREEFEFLFCETYDSSKNAAFLSKFGSSYNQNLFTTIVKMMIKISKKILNKSKIEMNELPENINALLPRWEQLKLKLLKLDSQLSKSINISFAFIPGSLVNCIKNGDWVLLDEINLASAETLECLSTILEPDGSIVLLEKGDFTPVRRHSDFRIFACMNPNTDIGKKDLPIGIRNRFTEFFVDELTTDNDLNLLVSDYLINTGIQRKSVTNIVKLYKKLRQMAKFDLNDGLGNRPVYSLRTLCRSLRNCAKNLCGSIERNLYESFCMSFLTQLDTDSHKIVLNLIQNALISNVKAVLKQSIPCPGENFLNFEGYWIEKGQKLLQNCESYILTDSVKSNLKDLARIISIGKLPILLQGPTSAGKTSLIEYVAKCSGNYCLRINNHEHTDLQEYIGSYIADESGNLSFREGILVQAMRNGYWIILDELNLASTEILEALNRVLDDNRELFIPETQRVIKAHSNFMLFATQNPPGLYGGRKTLSRAFKNRFIELHFSEIPHRELEIILEKRCLIPASYAKKMVICMSELQKNRLQTSTKNVFTLRDLFRWGNRYTYADKRLLVNNHQYDWNQHLVEEGYLVLSSKVRSPLEIEIIEQTLYKNFKKHIILSRLFDVHATIDKCSAVISDIIEAIKSFKQRSDIVWTRNMTRMAVLTAKALQFDEPVLLVGPTGCGKTTVCQLLASIRGVQLRILNCHMHTEGADFLGGLRPFRQNSTSNSNDANSSQSKLFEWADGPLVNSMLDGSYFMADEISLAEDSVLERLNCILEPERTVLLAEKGGASINDKNEEQLHAIANDFVIKAKVGFQFLATMNPAGDYGKKELSPALRNRFTEIWCLPTEEKDELILIASNCMREQLAEENARNIASYFVEVVLHMRDNVDKFKYSIRDIIAWANYMKCNESLLTFAERAIFGLETIFLDALEMLPHESIEQIDSLRMKITQFAIDCAAQLLSEKFTISELESKRGKKVICENGSFGITPFLIPINVSAQILSKDFSFSAPTTKKNLFRLLSALSLQKPILLEGPPGVGKTSIVDSLAKAIGFNIVRINLCEHTDLADLFGTDLPAADNILSMQPMGGKSTEKINVNVNVGSFLWRDGPLLSALKSSDTWVLLDELNLAPQSVLEGLNAILDHRGEVFIPELNKTFSLNRNTRIFACQNPLRHGGGRKGLPQSFLNRFNKVYLRKLTTMDLKYVVNEKYSLQFEALKVQLFAPFHEHQLTSYDLFQLQREIQQEKKIIIAAADTLPENIEFDLSERLVRFSEALDFGIAQMEFGYRGGPYEFNLRDILRWCDFLFDPETGVHLSTSSSSSIIDPAIEFQKNFASFLQTLYDTMKLVYMQRMRTVQDQQYIRNVFGCVFECNAEYYHAISEDVSLYWTDEHLYLNDLVIERDGILSRKHQLRPFASKQNSPLLLSTQREHLQNIVACVQHQKPILLCGPTDAGKTKLIDVLCTLTNQVCNTDNIDDSVTGSFQQIDLNRHLEELSQNIESIFWSHVQKRIIERKQKSAAASLLSEWYKHTNDDNKSNELASNQTSTVSHELQYFQLRLDHLVRLTQRLLMETGHSKSIKENLETIISSLNILRNFTRHAETLNMGGSFEWVDSKIVKSLKYGQYIVLEHVNLCSSAVLDRLNPIFEPNGNLLISEKGVSATDSAEIVEKAPNFRSFLTIDPKNGELSRAMRNRCVELAIQKDIYSIDDMRQIIYTHGIHDIIAINCIISLHNSIKELTEINNYSISQMNQCAFLVAAYKRIGYATTRSIYVSGMEVYVYAANTDLLGYGLGYYQNKLRDIVLEHMQQYLRNICEKMAQEDNCCCDYTENLILRCCDLNSLSMIKLQAIPLKLLLENGNIHILSLYLDELKNINGFENLNYTKFLRYYICIIYECSSFIELELRHKYLQNILKNHTELSALSSSLYDSIRKFKERRIPLEQLPQHLPWNTKLFSRIRTYKNVVASNRNIICCLSALLLGSVLLERIPAESLDNLQNLSALDYSRALNKKLVTAKSNHTFLKKLDNLIDLILNLLKLKVSNNNTLDISDLINFSTKIHWFNRLVLLAANTSIFKRNEIDLNLLDKLMLHYEWLCKRLLQFLAHLNDKDDYRKFGEIFKEIDEFITTIKPKLNLLCKRYTKNMLAFQPFYKAEQVELKKLQFQLDQLLRVIPSYGSLTMDQIQRKFQCQKEQAAIKAYAFIKGNIDCRILMPEITLKLNTKLIPTIINDDQFLANLNELNAIKVNAEVVIIENDKVDELRNEIENIRNILNSQNEFALLLPKEIEIGVLILKEYYLTKALVHKVENISHNSTEDLNVIYCDELSTLSSEDWHLISVYSESRHARFLSFLKHLIQYILRLGSSSSSSSSSRLSDFGEIINSLNGSYKEINAVWRDLLFKSQNRQLFNLSKRFSCTQLNNNDETINAVNNYEGPTLVNAILSLIFNGDGSFKQVPLKDLNIWQKSLSKISQIMWQNASLLTKTFDQLKNNSKIAYLHGEKLLIEINYNCIEFENNNTMNQEYKSLLQKLKNQLEENLQNVNNEEKTMIHAALHYQNLQYSTAMLNALIGAVELSTLISTPLIDPVEKKRLKKVYLEEDINHLKTLIAVYDFMRITLKYKNFGNEFYKELGKQLEELEIKQLKYNKNMALRPQECLYMELVQHIKYYLSTNCTPAGLLKLLEEVKNIWKSTEFIVHDEEEEEDEKEDEKEEERFREISMKLELWISNAQRFICHILKPYMGYYEDLLQPIRCAVQQFTFGLESLRIGLYQMQMQHKRNHSIQRLIGNFAEFPNTRVLRATPKSRIISKENINERLSMLQLRLDTLGRHVNIVKEFNDESLNYLNATLAEYNEIWQLEEEQIRQRKAEEDSLYVRKTKCETIDEEVVEQEEINEIFPTNVQEDFGDYLITDTLEQTKKKIESKIHKKFKQILDDELIANIAHDFIILLEENVVSFYYNNNNNNNNNNNKNTLQNESLDIVSMAVKRLKTFAMLFERHKHGLNDSLDERAYNSLCLAVATQTKLLHNKSNEHTNGNLQKTTNSNCYNFYKDSNIGEIFECIELLERIAALVKIQLDAYPEHASLIDIQKIIIRICQLPSNASLVRFSTGFQLLRQKLAQWNEIAHKNNHLRNEEAELAEYVQKWMRLELQCWRNCLNQQENRIEAHGYRYWFYIYNLLQEYLQCNELDSSYTDIKYTEKRFGDAEILDDSDLREKKIVNLIDIIRILRQFVESSCYGDFHVRIRLLHAFELYLQCQKLEISNEQIDTLIAALHNLQIYYSQFTQEIIEFKQSIRAPIEKKLKELVKIESYNKDLSYFSMRNNVARVHRNLNKFLKEYRQQLQQKIIPVFQPQDATVKDYNFENVKGKALRFDNKVKYNIMIDIKYFIAPDEPKNLQSSFKINSTITDTTTTTTQLLSRASKHFRTSRNVVKLTIQHSSYPQMIMALDELLISQLERCENLRSLKVDRSKERPKQVLEAKQILQQKRKGLTDLFKILTELGVSYKAGLLEQNLSTEFVDYTLPPFCIRNMMLSGDSRKEKQIIVANMLQLYEHLDRYYAKSVFKLKLLQNVMLTPLSELGPPNIERIKGFSVSMFLLVQQQRRLLATTTRDCYDFKFSLKRLKSLIQLSTSTSTSTNTTNEYAPHLCFSNHNRIFRALKSSSTQIRFVFEQFAVLLDCAPQESSSNLQVLNKSTNGVLTKDNDNYRNLNKNCTKALEMVKSLLENMSACDEKFLDLTKIEELKKQHDHLIKITKSMQKLCEVSSDKNECLPLAKPLTSLLDYIEHTTTNVFDEVRIDLEEIGTEKIEEILAEILHRILLSLQKLYKQHEKPALNSSEIVEGGGGGGKSSPVKRSNNADEDENELKEQHLKTLYNSLDIDWCSLNVRSIVKKLEGLLENLCATPPAISDIQKLATLLPLLEQYYLMAEYELLQQLGAHKVSAKMLSIMLTVFVEIGTKGFCVPPDLMHDEEQNEKKKEQKDGEGFGLEDGTGEKDVSDKIESEDQLDDAKRPEDRNKDDQQKQENCKEEKGIEMSEDFDGEMQDIEKPENEEDDSDESEDEDELNKEMGETEDGTEKLDEQIWGDDEEEEDENSEMKDEDEGKGTKDEKDTHNDLDANNEAAENKENNELENDGLDATNQPPEEDKRKKQKPDIDNLKEPEVNEDQDNPYHNELEEPPEPEEMDLGDMNNNDEENDGGGDHENNENPFDIDSMKENMTETKEENETDDKENDEEKLENTNDGDISDDSDEEGVDEQNANDKEEQKAADDEEKVDENQDEENEADTQKRGGLDDDDDDDKQDDDTETEQENKDENQEEYKPSKDKPSEENNVQSMPNTDDKASADKTPNDQVDKNVKQEEKMDEQETGEEKDGVGQAENEENDGGHQGIAETKETISKEDRKNEQQTKEKRKQGQTNEERSLGEAAKNKLKKLKTIEKLKENNEETKDNADDDDDDDDKDLESEEYQHVKEPKKNDKTTLDNATEEQSKKIQHKEDEKTEEDTEEMDATETNDELMEIDENENPEEFENLEEVSAEKNESKSEKPSKTEKAKECSETEEKIEVEGEIVATMNVPRSDDTTAHCNKEILLDTTQTEEMSATKLLEMRKLYQRQMETSKGALPGHEHYESWQTISNRMSQNARELCEQLRLILEPTKCTRLKGDYRTGRRINMKKIIPYIASQFRKDKIWLRRTKPAQRDYKITIAIDDSKSMHHNNSKILTLEAISLISQALTLLESGRLSVVSFGEGPKIILNHTDQFDGPKLVNSLNFSQEKTKVAELLDFIRTVNTEEGGACSSDNGIFENLLLVLSDGRNIFSEGKTKVKNSIKLARLQRIFLVYVIIDNPENKNSILDIQTMEMLPDSRINIKSYLDDFPFPYYVIVRDLNQLPLVLSEAMRQWFELVNSEQ